MSAASDSEASPAILLVDDDEALASSLLRRLQREEPDFRFHYSQTASSAVQLLHEQRPEVAVVDLELDVARGPESGLSLIAEIFKRDPSVRVLALTGHDASRVGLAALRAGAASFLRKPAELQQLLALIHDGVAYARLKRAFSRLENSSTIHQATLGMSSKSERMQQVLELVRYAASNSVPVLLLGETGTGKGLLARTIHHASNRRAAPFVRVQPQHGSAELAAAELFGHTRGAFTGAISERKGMLSLANKGTLFLDEVDHLPRESQVSLLEALQERRFRPLGSVQEVRSDFRLIAASNRAELVADDALRQDFYHRIAHCVINIPALRERREDISQLAYEMLESLCKREDLPIVGFSPDALRYLEQHPWPGNVRQLHAVVEAAAFKAAFREHSVVDLAEVQIEHTPGLVYTELGDFRERVRTFELQLVQQALRAFDNNQSKAAASLQLDRSSFRRILARARS